MHVKWRNSGIINTYSNCTFTMLLFLLFSGDHHIMRILTCVILVLLPCAVTAAFNGKKQVVHILLCCYLNVAAIDHIQDVRHDGFDSHL